MTNQTLPDWYNNSKMDAADNLPQAKRKAGIPVRRALAHMAETLARELSTPVCGDSWLRAVEPRAKIAGIFLLVIATTLLHTLQALGVVFGVAIVLAASIGLSWRRLGRAWLGVPLFSLAIILPAALNLVTPGHPVLVLVKLGHAIRIGGWTIPQSIAVTDGGIIVASRFLLRSISCITLSYLLVATTEPAVLLNGLRGLGMPRVFGMVLTMAQRYLTVILRVAEEIHLAKLSRTITAGPLRNEQRWVAAGIGMLFRRTHKLTEEVHHAMISRGYDGDLRLRFRTHLHAKDAIWLSAVCLVTAGVVLIDRLTLLWRTI